MSHESDRVKLENLTLENMGLVEIEPSEVKPDLAIPETEAPPQSKPKRDKFKARLRRTLRSSFAVFARPDDAWAKSLLSDAEYSVYSRMDSRDREHAVRVARMLLELHPDAGRLVVRAALLHDCGKQVRPYNLLERIWVGLTVEEPDQLTRLNTDRLARLTSTRPARLGSRRARPERAERMSAADVRRYHPQIGAWLIRAAGGDERVSLIVEYHHHPGDDLEIGWIHEVDELE